MSDERPDPGGGKPNHTVREEHERLIAILEATNDFVSTATPDGRISYVNRAGREMLGWVEHEEGGYSLIAEAHPDWAARLVMEEGVPAAVRDGIWKGETAVVGPDGNEIPVSQVIMAHMGPDGKLAYLSTIIRDISELKRTEAELEKARALLLAAIEQSPAGILLADAPDVRIRFANSAALGIRGESGAPLTEIPVELHPQNWQVFHPDGRPFAPEDLPLSQAVLFGNTCRNVEAVIRSADGEDRWVLANSAPVRNSGGEVTAGVVVFTDITERRQSEEERFRLEAQLRQAQKMEAVGQLAGGVAHDFNNMLTAILGNLELTLEEIRIRFGERDPLVDYLQQADRSAKRASTLTRQLLAFSRRQVVQPRVLDLNRTLSEMKGMIRRLIQEDIDLVAELAGVLSSIRADAGQVEQVVMNLVVNARDAMPGGGKLTIATSNVVLDEQYCRSRNDLDPGPYIQLVVSDTGCGMDDITQERIFEPFFTTKEVGQGTGLGLSMVYGIVKQAGGHITVSSVPDRGTTFRIYLPVVEPGDGVQEDDPGAVASAPGTGTVLVCEDDEGVRALAVRMLEGAGYRVLEAMSTSDAIRIAGEYGDSIDLLLTDVIMPGMNGRQLSEKLSEQRPTLRTLYISGYASDVIAHHGVLEDGMHLLEKPFTRQELLKNVHEVMGGKG